jgi:hypothetical protein
MQEDVFSSQKTLPIKKVLNLKKDRKYLALKSKKELLAERQLNAQSFKKKVA